MGAGGGPGGAGPGASLAAKVVGAAAGPAMSGGGECSLDQQGMGDEEEEEVQEVHNAWEPVARYVTNEFPCPPPWTSKT